MVIRSVLSRCDLAQFLIASEVAEHGLGDFRIRVGRKGPSQHGGSNCQVEQAQPAMHAGQGFQHTAVALQGNGLKASGNGNLAADGFLQELLVEALDSRQNSQLPLRILYHRCSQRADPFGCRGGPTLVKIKLRGSTSLS